MRSVGLKTLKTKLSEYVRLAAAGETIVITDGNRVVAEIVPPRRGPESVIERGVREGWIRPAVRGPNWPPPAKPVPGEDRESRCRPGCPNWPPPAKPVPGLTLEQLMADLDRDREDR